MLSKLSRLSLLAVAFSPSLAAQAVEHDIIWADRWNSGYHRFSDGDGDGTFLGDGEVSLMLSLSSPASEAPLSMKVTVEDGLPVAYWLPQFSDTIARGVDLNSDGILTGPEITVFRDSGALDGNSAPQDLALTDDGAIWWSAGLIIAIPHNGISRLEDLNGDGDAADAGEHAHMVDGSNPTHPIEHDLGTTAIPTWGFSTIAAAGDGVLAFSDQGGSNLYRFEDLNSDGDVLDAGESVLLINSSGVNPSFPMNPDFADGTLKNLNLQAGYPARFSYFESVMEDGERVFYFGTGASGTPGSSSTNINGEGVNFLIFRGVDLNGDRDVNDDGEVQLFFDGSHTDGSPVMLLMRGMAVAEGGQVYAVELLPYPALFPGPNGNTWIHRLQDLNSDGDAMDPGELELDLFDLQAYADFDLFPLPPLFGNMMADPWDLSVSPRFLFEPAFSSSESGCSFPSGTAPVGGGLGSGIQGSPFTFTLDGALPSALAAWTFGTSTTNWLGLPLPLDLVTFGYPGCALYQNLEGSVSVGTDIAGHAEFTSSVPVSPALSGIEIPTQWLVFGIGALQTTGLGSLLIK